MFQFKFNQASRINSLAFIYEEFSLRMKDRLDFILNDNVDTILDLGHGLGFDYNVLKEKYPKSDIFAIDYAHNLNKTYSNRMIVTANAKKLPLKNSSMNIVLSNQCIELNINPELVLFNIFNVLKPNGFTLLSVLGVDTFKELRQVGLRTIEFLDLHLLGDYLNKQGFQNTVTDTEYLQIEYDNITTLLADIKAVGLYKIPNDKYYTKTQYLCLEKNLRNLNVDNKLIITLELIFAHAWKFNSKINTQGISPILFYPKP